MLVVEDGVCNVAYTVEAKVAISWIGAKGGGGVGLLEVSGVPE